MCIRDSPNFIPPDPTALANTVVDAGFDQAENAITKNNENKNSDI
jgi:hypothetical protein